MYLLVEFSVAVLPIIVFLFSMWMLDSFQLIGFKEILLTIFYGFIIAGLTVLIHNQLVQFFELDKRTLSQLIAPFTEESLKLLPVIILMKKHQVGFMIDAAIYGLCIGAGFAIIENIYYLNSIENASIIIWIVRGFGTAVMHAGTTAIAAIISKDIIDTKNWSGYLPFLPGLLAAALIHGLFNLFILPPTTSALIIILILPALFYSVFKKSEEHTRNWLGTGLDSDMDLLQIVMSGEISDSKIGIYVKSIQEKFEPITVGDIICYLRVYLELSIKAKGVLIMKESGIDLPPDPVIEAQFEELKYLDKQIGTMGKIAIQPLLNTKSADLWQLSLIK